MGQRKMEFKSVAGKATWGSSLMKFWFLVKTSFYVCIKGIRFAKEIMCG